MVVESRLWNGSSREATEREPALYHICLGLPLSLGADTWEMLRRRWPLLFFRRFQCRLEGPRGVKGSFCERSRENIWSLHLPRVSAAFASHAVCKLRSLKYILTHHFLPPPQSPVLVNHPPPPDLLSPWTQTLLEWKECGGEGGLLNQETQTSYYSKLRKWQEKKSPLEIYHSHPARLPPLILKIKRLSYFMPG